MGIETPASARPPDTDKPGGGAAGKTRTAVARRPEWPYRLGSTLVVMVAWELYSSQVNPLLLPAPSRIVMAFWQMLVKGEILTAALTSLEPFALGLVLAIVLGIAFGALLGRFRLADLYLSHLINAVYVVPPVALVPVIMMWFGLGVQAKTFIVLLIAVFPILFNTLDGVRSISRQYVDIAQAYGAGEWQVFQEVTIPAALPFIMSGLRQGFGRALIGLIVAELFTAMSGLGGMIAMYSNTLETAKVYVAVILLGLVGTALIAFGSWLELKAAPWRRSERAW